MENLTYFTVRNNTKDKIKKFDNLSKQNYTKKNTLDMSEIVQYIQPKLISKRKIPPKEIVQVLRNNTKNGSHRYCERNMRFTRNEKQEILHDEERIIKTTKTQQLNLTKSRN